MNQTSPSGKHTTTAEPSASSAPKAAHTPGPWKLTGSPGTKRPQWEYVYGGDRGLQQIATIMQSTGSASTPDSQEEAEANARLIANAPTTAAELERVKAQRDELREACRRALAYLELTAGSRGVLHDVLRAALAKATQP